MSDTQSSHDSVYLDTVEVSDTQCTLSVFRHTVEVRYTVYSDSLYLTGTVEVSDTQCTLILCF